MATLTLDTGETLEDIRRDLDDLGGTSRPMPLLDDARAVHDELDEIRREVMDVQTRLRRLRQFKNGGGQ